MALYFLVSGSSWSFPNGWPGYATKVECLGSGGNGSARISSSRAGNGGGGGEYAAETTDGSGHVNITSTPTFTVGTGGGTANTSITCDSITITAHPGGNATAAASGNGAGGTGSANTTHFAGGAGRATPASTASGGGGGGAAGPSGAGSAAASDVGGAANNSTDAAPAAGNAGNSGTEWDASHGCGTGGSGFASGTNNGTAGGLYGGGGSGASDGGAGSTGGAGQNGLIIITYTPLTQAVNITQSDHASLVAVGTLAIQGDPEEVTVGRLITHNVAISQSEHVVTSQSKTFFRTFTPSSSESLSTIKQAQPSARAISSPDLLSEIRKVGKNPIVASVQSISSPMKAMTHAVSVVDAEVLGAAKQGPPVKVSFVDAEHLTAAKAVSHIASILDTETVTAIKAITKVPFLLSPPQVWSATQINSNLSGGGTYDVVQGGTNVLATAFGTNTVTIGKFYWEAWSTNFSISNNEGFGIGNINSSITTGQYLGIGEDTLGVYINANGNPEIWVNGVNQLTITAVTWSTNQNIGFALDLINNLLWIKDTTAGSSWYGSSASVAGNPTLGTNGFSLTQAGFTIINQPVVPGVTLYVNGSSGFGYFTPYNPSGVSVWWGSPPTGFEQFASNSQIASLTTIKARNFAVPAIHDGQSVTRVLELGKGPTLSDSQLVIQSRAVSRTVALQDAEQLTASKVVGRAVTFTDGESAFVSEIASHSRTITFTGGQLLSALRQIRWSRGVTAPQSLTQTSSAIRPSNVVFLSSDVLALLRMSGKLLTVAEINALTIVHALSKTITVQNNTALLMAVAANHLRAVIAASSELLSVTRSITVTHVITTVQSVITQIVSGLFSLTQSQALSVAAAHLTSFTALITQSEAVGRVLTVGKYLSPQNTESLSIGRIIGLNRVVTMLQSISEQRQIAITRLLQLLEALTVVAAKISSNIQHTESIAVLSSQMLVANKRSPLSTLFLQAEQIIETSADRFKTITASVTETVTRIAVIGKHIFAIIVDPIIFSAQRAHEVDIFSPETILIRRFAGRTLTFLSSQHASLVAVATLLSHGLLQFISVAKAVTAFRSVTSSESLTSSQIKTGSSHMQAVSTVQGELVSRGFSLIGKGIFIPPAPIVTFMPPNPFIPSTALGGTQVALIVVNMTDGSTFAGQLSFIAPNFNDGGIYAIDNSVGTVTYNGNNYITINPNGPGVSTQGGTIDNLTVGATALPLAGTQQFSLLAIHGPYHITTSTLTTEALTVAHTTGIPITMQSGEQTVLARQIVKILTLINAQFISFSHAIAKIVSVFSTQLLTRRLLIARSTILTSAQLLTYHIVQSTTIRFFSGQHLTLVAGKLALRNVTITSIGLITRSAITLKFVVISTIEAVSRKVAVARLVAITSMQQVTRGFTGYGKGMPLVNPEHVTSTQAIFVPVLIMAAESILVKRASMKYLTVLSSGIITRLSAVSRQVTIASAQTVIRLLRAPSNLVIHLAQLVQTVASKVHPKAISFAGLFDPSQGVQTGTIFGKAIAPISPQIITSIEHTRRAVLVLLSSASLVSRGFLKTLTVSSSQVVSTGARVAQRTLSIAQSALVTLQAGFGKGAVIISLAQPSVVTLSELFHLRSFFANVTQGAKVNVAAIFARLFTQAQLTFQWLGLYTLSWGPGMPTSAIINLPNGPIPAGTTPIFNAQFLDPTGNPVPAFRLTQVTLSLVDTVSGQVINGISEIDILNQDRGTVDSNGNLTISLLASDTSLSESPGVSSVQRSLIVDWQSGPYSGSAQGNFIITALAGG